MKAFVCRELSSDLGKLQLEDVELPPLAPDEVRLRIRAAGVNFPDLLMARGKYQHKPELPFVVGGERSGEVIAVGADVTALKVGDSVIGAGVTGGFAEECQLPADAVRPLPAGTGFATAACFTTAYLTAYVALVRRAELRLGETLLVHGAAGGVGLAAVDLGRVLGARVIATASTQEKRDFLNDYGADHVLPSSGFRGAVKGLTDGRGADVVKALPTIRHHVAR
jgi:NADPH2:quinone reductase